MDKFSRGNSFQSNSYQDDNDNYNEMDEFKVDITMQIQIITKIIKRVSKNEDPCICSNNPELLENTENSEASNNQCNQNNQNNQILFNEIEIIPSIQVPCLNGAEINSYQQSLNINHKLGPLDLQALNSTENMINNLSENQQNNKNNNGKFGIFNDSFQMDNPHPYYMSNDKIEYIIQVSELCNALKILGYPITGSMISIYNYIVDDYVFYGNDPIAQNITLGVKSLDLKRFKMKIINYVDEKMLKDVPGLYIKSNIANNNNDSCFEEDTLSDGEEEVSNIDDKSQTDNQGNKKEKRNKERKIGFIIEKVNAWRKLYNGFYDEHNEHTKYSLDKAADIIKVSKKSLDDYLLQLRLGRKYGFDFNKNKNERVGKLRSYVKLKKAEEDKKLGIYKDPELKNKGSGKKKDE